MKLTHVLLLGGNDVSRDLNSLFSSRQPARIETISDDAGIEGRLGEPGVDLIVVDDDFGFFANQRKRLRLIRALGNSKKPFVILSSKNDPALIEEANRNGASDYILKPYNHREFIMRFNAIAMGKTRISCIGGGTGLFTLLLGLKTLPNALLTSIVNMSDDGGSSGKLSQSMGVLPPGDIRRSLVALSNAPELMNQIVQYRFEHDGVFQGHNFGNIFLAVLAQIKGSMPEAVRALSDILNIQGIVLPSTTTLIKLAARFEGGLVVKGESKIDLCEGRDGDLHIEKLWHEPDAECDADAFSAIINSELVTIGPGDLYTSVITNLSVKGLCEALSKTKAKKLYICNLMTKPGETANYSAYEHVSEVIKYMGGDFLDYILISNTALSKESIAEYVKKNQVPVKTGDIDNIRLLTKAQIITADIGDQTELVRHDSEKLKKEVQKIVQGIG